MVRIKDENLGLPMKIRVGDEDEKSEWRKIRRGKLVVKILGGESE